jgi:hypothetical protein
MTAPRPRAWWLVFVLAWVACRPGRTTTTPEAESPWAHAAYREGPPPATTKVFLVAGGDDIANFAAEIVEQRRLWRGAGLRDDEIACYWAHPTPRAYDVDRAQYDALRHELASCYRAEPATVLGDLRRAATEKLPWVYLFVTGHGLPPLMRWVPANARSAARRHRLTAEELARLDHHAIGLQAGPGPTLEQVDRVVMGHRAGAPTSSLMLSPPTLAEALADFDPATPKFVVLQACYSGGFIAGAAGPSALHDVPNLTLLTATTHDRSSFGCGAGKAKTYYGGSFNRVLTEHLQLDARPPDLAWVAIHDEVRVVIDALESIDAERSSRPQLLQTPPPSAPDSDGPAAWTALSTALPGQWRGTIGETAIVVDYQLTARGSVLLETWMPGTPAETLTTYHLDGDELMATHYCGQGNQPRLRLGSNSSDGWSFSRFDATNETVDAGMLAELTLALTGDDLVRTETYTRGAERETTVLPLRRVPSAAR